MSTKPRTIHLQKALDKIKSNSIDTDIGSEYLLLLEQMSILTDIQTSYNEEMTGVKEVLAEMEKSRVQIEVQFQQHLTSSAVIDTKIDEIHDRLMSPDNGLIVQSKDIQRRLEDLEGINSQKTTEEKENTKESKEEAIETARIKSEKRWRMIYIVAFSVMILSVFGKQVGLPLIKTLLVILP